MIRLYNPEHVIWIDKHETFNANVARKLYMLRVKITTGEVEEWPFESEACRDEAFNSINVSFRKENVP